MAGVKATVLHVLEAIEGGVARHMLNVVRNVDAHHIVATPLERAGGVTDTAALESMAAAGARLELVDMRRSPTHPRKLVAVGKVQRIARRTRPDVIHGHSAIGGAVGRLAAIGSQTPCVYTPHGFFPARSAWAVERALAPLTDCLVAASKSEAEQAQQHGVAVRGRVVVIPNVVDPRECGTPVFDLR